jgi:DNA polymerase I-like protein with 3'-5' exonuclease and polymerase domains
MLLPGYKKLADEEKARQAEINRVSALPLAPAFAAGPIHVIDTKAEAAKWAELLRNEAVSVIGVDTEYRYDRPGVVLKRGQTFEDVSSIRPLVCTLAVWCGATRATDDTTGMLIRLLYDLRKPEVHGGLREVFRLRVPWVAHYAKAEFHCLYACGIEPAGHLLIDTHVTAAALNLGTFHTRDKNAVAKEANRLKRELKEKEAHVTSLIGQCERYGLRYPFNKHEKDELRERFLRLGPDDPLDGCMKEYAAADAEYALRVHLAQTPDVQQFGLEPHLAQIEWPLVAVLARIERTGLPASRGKMQEYRELCGAVAEAKAKELEKWNITAGSRRSFLLAMNRAGVLQKFVVDGKYCTKDEVLRRLEQEKVHEAIKPFRLFQYFRRQAESELLAGVLISADGRQRYTLDQLGSASGRIASSKPNLVGLDGRLRPMFVAPPGYVFVEIDFKQKEIGVAAAEWNDAGLVEKFNTGDAYAGVAQSLYADQLTAEERAMPSPEFAKVKPKLRKKTKPLALGMIYGSGPRSVAAKLGVSVPQAEAELRRFFDLFPDVRNGAAGAVESSLVRGYGLTATGLRRFIEKGSGRARNAMRNHPIQGSACAIFKTALLRIDGYYRNTKTQIVMPRHDSVVLLTPAGTEAEVIAACKVIMVGAVREKYPDLQPGIDADSGVSWPTELSLEEYHRKECTVAEPSALAGPVAL